MTVEEWEKDFKSFVNELQMPRDDYKGIMEYIDDAISLLKEQEHKDKMFHALEDDWKRLKALLKEQEAVEPKQVDLYGNDEWWGLVCVCPDCKAEWMSDKADTHFCPKCGRAVKWE